jgi:hypothetical protein
LQCVLAARILIVDFVVCTLAVKKKIRAGFDMSDRTIPLLVLSFCEAKPSYIRLVLNSNKTKQTPWL